MFKALVMVELLDPEEKKETGNGGKLVKEKKGTGLF